MLVPEGTTAQLCTQAMLVWLKRRAWVGRRWVVPPRSENNKGEKGFILINLPLSNVDDNNDRLIVSAKYLADENLLPLTANVMTRAGKVLDSESKEFAPLAKAFAAGLGVSAATFAYTFLIWLDEVYIPELAAQVSRESVNG